MNKTNTQFIIESIKDISGDIISDNVCYLCGGNNTIEKWYNKKEIISGTFMDYNLCKGKTSNVICSYCVDCLSGSLLKTINDKDCGIRLYSFISEQNKFTIITYTNRKDIIFNYQFTIPFILAISFSGQKHISFKSVFSYSNDEFYICTENGNILFNRKVWEPIFIQLQLLYNKGVSKDELKNCQIIPWKYNKYVLPLNCLNSLFIHKNKLQYNFLIEILSKEKTKDDKNKCYDQSVIPGICGE